MVVKDTMKKVFGIILTIIASLFLLSAFIVLVAPSDNISDKIIPFVVLFVIGIIPLIFGIKLLRPTGVKSQVVSNARVEIKNTSNISMDSKVETIQVNKTVTKNKATEQKQNELTKDGMIPLYDDLEILFENSYGEKNWHKLDKPRVMKNWYGDICILSEGSNKETISYYLRKILELKVNGDDTSPEDYFAPIKKCFQEIVDDYKIKADNIVKKIEGFENAIIYHCAIQNTIAFSKELKGFALFTKENNIAKTIDEIKNTSFNKSKSVITLYLNNEDLPKVYIQITCDFGEPEILYDRIKETIEQIK